MTAQSTKSSNPLRLRAVDEQSIEVLSECLFEAVAFGAGMRFDQTAGRFVMALERFTWEAAAGDDTRLRQVPCILSVEHVVRVAQTGLGEAARSRIFSLSSFAFESGALLVLFDEGAAVRIDVNGIECRLEDTRPGRLPPVVPGHRRGLA